MTNAAPHPARRSRLNSIFIKASAILALCTAVVVVVPAYFNTQRIEQFANADIRERAAALVDLLGHQTGDAIDSGDQARIDAIATTAIDNATPHILSAMVISPRGEILSRAGLEGADQTGMRELGHQAILAAEAGRSAGGERASQVEELVISEDGMTTAHPAYFGPDDRIVAAIVTRWSSAVEVARVQSKETFIYLLAAGLYAAAVLMSSLVFRAMISRPLTLVNSAMQAVAAGNYEAQVPALQRGDELGAIARSLEGFRASLQQGRAARG